MRKKRISIFEEKSYFGSSGELVRNFAVCPIVSYRIQLIYSYRAGCVDLTATDIRIQTANFKRLALCNRAGVLAGTLNLKGADIVIDHVEVRGTNRVVIRVEGQEVRVTFIELTALAVEVVSVVVLVAVFISTAAARGSCNNRK